jgi:hypothetical protein
LFIVYGIPNFIRNIYITYYPTWLSFGINIIVEPYEIANDEVFPKLTDIYILGIGSLHAISGKVIILILLLLIF